MDLLEKIFPPVSREKFAHRLLRTIRRANPSCAAKFDPNAFSITRSPGGTIFLHNAYDEYRRTPPLKRKAVFAFYARFNPDGSPGLPATFANAAPHLLPKLRERLALESLKWRALAEPDKNPAIAHQLLNDHLTLELVYDTPQSMATINEEQLAKWGVSFDQAMQQARDNLWKISNEDWLQPSPGLFVAPWQDFHAASRLCLHDLIWQLPVKGAHVAIVPNRNALFVAGDQDEAALQAMATLTEQLLAEPRFMTAIAFRLESKCWQPWVPSPTSAAYAAFRSLQVRSIGQAYAEQKQALDAFHTRSALPNPPFVASFSAATDAAGKLVTFAVWPEGAETLLPDADCIHLGKRNGDKHENLGFVDGATLHRAFADLLEPQPGYPARWRTRGFPSPQQLASITLSKVPFSPAVADSPVPA